MNNLLSGKHFQKTIKRQDSWTRDLAENFADSGLDWESIYTNPYRSSRETKLQSFSFKVTHRLIPCNYYLHKLRIKESEQCSFCPATGTIKHFMCECPDVQQFWDRLTSWLDDYTHLSLMGLSSTNLLFGVSVGSHNWKTINWLVLFGKFFIKKQKLFGLGKFPLIQFLSEMKNSLATEEKICYLEGQKHKFHRWKDLYRALQ